MKKAALAVIMSFLWVMSVGALPVGADTIDIDFNDFYLEGAGGILNASSAFLEVDPVSGGGMLQNDPIWGDPGISVPSGALYLSFSYDFSEAAGNDTGFYVKLSDGHTGGFIKDFLLNETKIGDVKFDLTSLNWPTQNLLGLEFMLTEYNFDQDDNYMTGSTVTISNLKLVRTDQVVIPEPGTMMLMGAGLMAFGLLQRKRRQ